MFMFRKTGEGVDPPFAVQIYGKYSTRATDMRKKLM